jgi:hypothetical protein
MSTLICYHQLRSALAEKRYIVGNQSFIVNRMPVEPVFAHSFARKSTRCFNQSSA